MGNEKHAPEGAEELGGVRVHDTMVNNLVLEILQLFGRRERAIDEQVSFGEMVSSYKGNWVRTYTTRGGSNASQVVQSGSL